MKLKTRGLYLALLGVSLLLSLNAAAAQRHRSTNPKKPKATTPTPTPTPQPLTLKGTYILDDPGAATKTVNVAIEAAVQGLWPIVKGQARDKLKEKNLPPPPQITISYTAADVTIQTAAGTIQTPVNGTFVERTVLEEKTKVSTKWKGGKLERTFKGGEGQRVNTYSLGGDGKTLTMQVTVTSGWLKRPCVYELRYKRIP